MSGGIRVIAREQTVMQVLRDLYLPSRSLAKGSISQLEISVRSYGKFLGRLPLLPDLNRSGINEFVDALLLQGLAPRTAKNKRDDLIALWRFATDEGLSVEHLEAKKVKSPKVPRRDPDAWDRPELLRFIAACEQLRGHWKRTGIPRADYMRALALVIYSTGLRFTPATSLKRKDLQPDGSITAVWYTQKNRYSQNVQLDSAARAAVLAFGDCHELLLPGPSAKRYIWATWRKVCNMAGLPVGSRNGPQKMRRTAATWLESECPGAASQFLGHTDATLARKHYLDPRILRAGQRTPPPLQ